MTDEHISQIAQEIARVVSEKNKIYGSAVKKTAEICKILYPDGIPPEQYDHVLVIIRILDKICKQSNRAPGDRGPSAWNSIVGYGLVALVQEMEDAEDD